MITPFELYWILKLDDIISLFVILILISVIGIVVVPWIAFSTGWADSEKGNVAKTIKFTFIPLVLAVLFGLVQVFTPTTKQMATILLLPKIATEENVQLVSKEAKELYGLVKEFLKDEFNPEKDKENHERK